MKNYTPSYPNRRGHFKAPPVPPGNTEALSNLLSHFQTSLHMPDSGIVEITMGAYAANVLSGDPVWLMLVGPPSAGKGEILASLNGLPYLHAASTLTEAALLSGVKKKDREADACGGLLKEMGEFEGIGRFGILVMKDFTSVLSMSREARTSTLAALREIFDGAWTRRLGVDGGRSLYWSGKMGLIGGVTQALDSHHAVMGEMGPRFVLYRLPATDAQQQARRALTNSGHEAEMREQLRDHVRAFFAGLNLTVGDAPSTATPQADEPLVLLVEFASRCRSAVERHPYSREIILIPEAEAPARLIRSAAQLRRGLHTIGVNPQRARDLVTKTMLDCIPPVRRCVLNYLTSATSDRAASIVQSTGLAKETLRRALEDLRCHGIVESSASGWQISARWKEHVRIAYPQGVCRAVKLGGRAGMVDDD
jgi:hypothetical protein